ncbi:hypothetical protein EV426DRAFT_333358 [Tirmania nivea]|nr:hypothetical protein EV426DRAFT_333358 [Tirmania nivea]
MSSPPTMSPMSSPTSPTAPAPPSPATAAPPAIENASTSTTTSTADKNATAPSMSEEEITALLLRLSQKDTVTSVMILARSDGAIVRVTGALANPIESVDGTIGDRHAHARGLVAEYAGVVWRFVRASEEMVVGDLGRLGGLGAGVGVERGGVERGGGGGGAQGGNDDLKLLRVRTRRGELVIVPEGKFILVVVHDTPGK